VASNAVQVLAEAVIITGDGNCKAALCSQDGEGGTPSSCKNKPPPGLTVPFWLSRVARRNPQLVEGELRQQPRSGMHTIARLLQNAGLGTYVHPRAAD